MESSRAVESASSKGSRLTSWAVVLGKAGAVIAFLSSTVFGLVTYSKQQHEQKLQDFLQAYNTIHGELGQGIADSLDASIAPIYNSSDADFATARFRANIAKTSSERREAVTAMQAWLLRNILIKGKDPTHDQYVNVYQQALRNLIFLYDYAKAEPCAGLVVVSRFREEAYTFWYYYPGSFNFDGAQVTASATPEAVESEARKLRDPDWAKEQQRLCKL
jgi:hypothetical protein